jgi:hypothetical protein
MTAHQQGLTDICTATNNATITMGNGNSESATIIGTLPGTVCDQYGKKLNKVAIENVSYLRNGTFNLFSLMQMTAKRWIMGGNKSSIWIKKGRNEVTFDLMIPTTKGMMFPMYFARDAEIAGATIDQAPTMTIEQAHVRLGHSSEEATRKTAKALNWIITKGTLKPCDACAAPKAKQKNVPKTSSMSPSNTTKDKSRIYLDIATINCPDKKQAYKKNWCIMVDERTGTKFTDFYDTKDGIIEPTCAQLTRWETTGHGVKYIRMDNAGENTALQERSDSSDWKLGIKFQYAARNTPQQNHLVELGFAHITKLGRALMNHANVPLKWRFKLFAKAFKTATLLDGLRVIKLDGVNDTRFKHWCGTNPKFIEHLCTWGEVGTVNLKSIGTPMIADRGVQCMMVGYSTDHTSDCYEMWDPTTGGVHNTRDIIWLKRMYFPKVTINPPAGGDNIQVSINVQHSSIEAGEGTPIVVSNTTEVETTNVETVHDFEPDENQDDKDLEEQEIPETEGQRTRSGRNVKLPDRLITKMNAAANDYEIRLTPAEENYYAAMKEIGEFGLIGAGIGGGFVNTSELHVLKFDEAMTKTDKPNWNKAVLEEHDRFTDNTAFQAVNKDEIPKDTKIITSTWAMKKKDSGTY